MKQDEKINEIKIELVRVESRLNQKIGETESKLNQKIGETESKLGQELAGIKVDTTWIKWLFGGLLSFILILLSILTTLLFRLAG